MINIVCSSIVTAFEKEPIGSRVTAHGLFWEYLEAKVLEHDFSIGKVPGQAFINCPGALDWVSAGDGPRLTNPDAYCPRVHRGHVGLYLKRKYAGETKSCGAVVYTSEAYLNDPDITESEISWVKVSEATHMLVAVIASCCESPSPVTAHTFVRNLAGANNEAAVLTADEIRARAKEVDDHWSKYAVVAG